MSGFRSVRELHNMRSNMPPLHPTSPSAAQTGHAVLPGGVSQSAAAAIVAAATGAREALLRAYRGIRSDLDSRDYSSFSRHDLERFIEELCDAVEAFEHKTTSLPLALGAAAGVQPTVALGRASMHGHRGSRSAHPSGTPTAKANGDKHATVDEHLMSMAHLVDSFAGEAAPQGSPPQPQLRVPSIYFAKHLKESMAPGGGPLPLPDFSYPRVPSPTGEGGALAIATAFTSSPGSSSTGYPQPHHQLGKRRASSPTLNGTYNDPGFSTSLMSNSAIIFSRRTLRMGVDAAGFPTLNGYTVLDEIGSGAGGKVVLVSDALSSQMFAVKKIRRRVKEHTTRSAALDLSTSSEATALVTTATVAPRDTPGLQRQQTSLTQHPMLLSSGSSANGNAANGVVRHMSASYDFKREVAIMRKLRHPNLIRLHEVIDDGRDESVFLVMEYVRGGPIMSVEYDTNTCAPAAEPYPESVARTQFKAIAFALKYLHRHRIAHLDLKFSNILLNENGDPVIIDFGVSHEQPKGAGEGVSPRSPAKFGTPYAFSPECCEGVPASDMDLFANDVWALGIVLFGMLFRKLPFHAQNYAELREKICRDFLVIPHNCSNDARHLLTQMLCKDPRHRIVIDEICKHPFVKNAPRKGRGSVSFSTSTSKGGDGGSAPSRQPGAQQSDDDDGGEDNDGFNAPPVTVTADEVEDAISRDAMAAASLRISEHQLQLLHAAE